MKNFIDSDQDRDYWRALRNLTLNDGVLLILVDRSLQLRSS